MTETPETRAREFMNPNKSKSKGFTNFIRNPRTIWYGPHPCSSCGETVVKSSIYQDRGREQIYKLASDNE
jgi:hypothetical protein